jgi:2'-5' RNA ligase
MRWMEPSSWHVTLQFLGEVSADRCACVADQVRTVRAPAVELQFDRLDCLEHAGVIVAGVHRTDSLVRLQEAVTMATGHCGFQAEKRRFLPHVTMARRRGERRLPPGLQEKLHVTLRISTFWARECNLYESFLTSTGSRYAVRERFVFAEG